MAESSLRSSQHHRHHADTGRRGRRRLAWVLGLVIAFMGAEIVGGLLTHSLALLADAGHMLTDAAALGLSLFAMWIAQRPPTAERTFGYYRMEILAALANGAALVAISLYIFAEAYRRFQSPQRIAGGWMTTIAAGGLLVNLVGVWLLWSGREESLNLQGVWLHVLTDTLGSVQAIVAGLLVWLLDWKWADPVASVLIGCLVLYSSWGLLKKAVAVLMEGAPPHIDVDEVRDTMIGLDGVVAVHDLHIWTITSGFEACSAHVVVDRPSRGSLLGEIRGTLRERFGIDHITVQIEPEEFHGCRPHS